MEPNNSKNVVYCLYFRFIRSEIERNNETQHVKIDLNLIANRLKHTITIIKISVHSRVTGRSDFGIYDAF